LAVVAKFILVIHFTILSASKKYIWFVPVVVPVDAPYAQCIFGVCSYCCAYAKPLLYLFLS
jgi:hypothetical protein